MLSVLDCGFSLSGWLFVPRLLFYFITSDSGTVFLEISIFDMVCLIGDKESGEGLQFVIRG